MICPKCSFVIYIEFDTNIFVLYIYMKKYIKIGWLWKCIFFNSATRPYALSKLFEFRTGVVCPERGGSNRSIIGDPSSANTESSSDVSSHAITVRNYRCLKCRNYVNACKIQKLSNHFKYNILNLLWILIHWGIFLFYVDFVVWFMGVV